MKKISFKGMAAILLVLALVPALAACNTGTQVSQAPGMENQAAQVNDQPAKKITDREGNTIFLPEKADKIISMAPSVTETLIHLGLGDKIIAVDKYSVGIKGLPDGLPVFDMMAPDTESIAKLRPDIIFATGMSCAKGDDPFKPVTDLGVAMTYIPSSTSIDGIKEDIRFIGQVTGTEAGAASIIAEMEQKISAITTKIGDKKSGKSVFFEVSASPNLYSFGKGTFLNEIIELLGGKNIFADQESWITVSEEAVIRKNPDIIFTNVDYIEDPVGEILKRNGWNAISAVKDKRVYQISTNESSQPNEYVTEAITEMAKALYPDLFE